jgi:hypothetical protein
LVRGEIDRHERTKAGLNVGEKKGEPVEATNAGARRDRLRGRRGLLRWRRWRKRERRKRTVGAAVEPTAGKFG